MNIKYLGTQYGGWNIDLSLINENSIIWSAGIGTDISFDTELIKTSGVAIYAFDPTPRSIKWLKTQNIPKQFISHEYGISNIDGTKEFEFPEKEEYVSFKESNTKTKPTLSLPVKRVSTIMKHLGHNNIDVLKMDIEGSEYGVIDDLLQEKIFPIQLLIEFHDISKDIEYIDKLKTQYNWIGQNNRDFNFIKK